MEADTWEISSIAVSSCLALGKLLNLPETWLPKALMDMVILVPASSVGERVSQRIHVNTFRKCSMCVFTVIHLLHSTKVIKHLT